MYKDLVENFKGIQNLKVDLTQIYDLQKDETGTYGQFVDYLLSAVIGKRVFKVQKHKSLLSTYATVSDEAFALLILENNFDRWVEICISREIFKLWM